MSKLEVRSIDADSVFRVFTRTEKDATRLILDVRDNKEFKKQHILLAYNIRLSAGGNNLADCSKNTYKIKWGPEVWWNTDVIVYGAPGLKKDHPVCAFLVKEGRARSVSLLREGLPALQKNYSFLCSASTKAHRGLMYPSQVEPGVLYIGDWDQAEDKEHLQQLKIRRIITIHNHPERLKTSSSTKHMRIEAADVPTTDLTRYYNATYEFIEEGRAQGIATLVHCGAGVSRSAAICAAHQMRKHCWNADRALRLLVDRRSKVCPNEGFWRQLCALEESLGVPAKDRSDVDAPPAVDESFGYMGAVQVAAGAAGDKLEVKLSAARSGGTAERDTARAEKREPGALFLTVNLRHRWSPAMIVPSNAPRNTASSAIPYDRQVFRSEGGEAGSSDREAKRARAADSATDSAAALIVDISKEGVVRGKLELPVLKRHQRCVFGRGPDCHVRLEHASISRQHAALTVDADGSVRLVDMGSAHGTNVNGMWVKPQQAKDVKVGTTFRFGASSRVYTVKAINVFAQPTVAASNGQAGMPLFLHGQGKQALKALGVAVPSFPITTVDLASAVRPSRDVYGRRAEVMTVGALVDALTAKAETLQNLTIRKDVVVSGLHAQQGQLFVDGVEDGLFQSYDLPRLLVITEACPSLQSQLSTCCKGASFTPAAGGVAALLATGLPDSPSRQLSVHTKGTSAVAVFPQLHAAVVTTPASNVGLLSDPTALKSLLAAAGVAKSCVAPMVVAAMTSRPFMLEPGCAHCVGFTTQNGVDIVLVGPAAIQTHAPLFLDVSTSLHAAVQMVAEVARGGATRWDSAFREAAADLLAASKPPSESDSALAALGLGGGDVQRLSAWGEGVSPLHMCAL